MFVKLYTPDRHVLTEAALYGCVVSCCTCRHLQAILISLNGNALEQCVPAAMAAPLSSRVVVRLPRCNTSPRKGPRALMFRLGDMYNLYVTCTRDVTPWYNHEDGISRNPTIFVRDSLHMLSKVHIC
jgi:hypothetical protein